MTPYTLKNPIVRSARKAATVGAFAITIVAARPATVTPKTPPRADGLTITYTINSSSMSRQIKEMTNKLVTARLQGGSARMDFTTGSPAPGQNGAYMLIVGDGKQTAMVDDKDKRVLIMDVPSTESGAGTAGNNPQLNVSTTNASFKFHDLGDGGKILGYATRHVRTISGATMETKFDAITRKVITVDTTDRWIARDVEIDKNNLLAWSKSFAAGMKSSTPEMSAQMERYQQEFGRTGPALRFVMRTNVIDEKGNAHADTVTMEVTSLKKGAIDPSIFVIPGDYKVTNVADQLAGMRAKMDRAKPADSVKKEKGAN